MKTVLITGASRGIGAETARLFASQGDRVVVNYASSQTQAERLAKEIGGMAICADVANRGDVIRMFDQIRTAYGGVDILIHNAGIAESRLFTDLSEADWNRMLGVHLTGAFHCIQCALPHMIHQKKGKILTVSSIWGLTGSACEVAYSTAKAGLIGMTKALAKELGPSHIQVNCVAPGIIDTEMNANLDPETAEALKDETPLGVFGQPRDVAEALLFLASDAADFITGQVLSPNGGFLI